MPGEISGYQLANAAMEINPSIKVLLTSGYASISSLPKKELQDKFKLLKKPYTQIDMLTLIGNLLSGKDIEGDGSF